MTVYDLVGTRDRRDRFVVPGGGSAAWVAAGAGVNLTATSADVPYPAGLLAGDTLVLYYAAVPTGNVKMATPAGWSAGFEVNYSAAYWVQGFTKVAVGDESGNLAVTMASSTGAIVMMAFRGVRVATPMAQAIATQVAASTTALVGVGLTTTVPSIVVTLAHSFAGGGSATSSSGTERVDFQSAGTQLLYANTRDGTLPGAFAAVTVTLASNPLNTLKGVVEIELAAA